VSSLEGGPLPLLEAMACGLVPVVTDTGWASDLIVNHKNGIIIPVEANVEVVKNSIKKAYSIDSFLVRESVSKLTVESFVDIFRSNP
jgi:glycosyltransferase involved in cell wall biosynthesis